MSEQLFHFENFVKIVVLQKINYNAQKFPTCVENLMMNMYTELMSNTSTVFWKSMRYKASPHTAEQFQTLFSDSVHSSSSFFTLLTDFVNNHHKKYLSNNCSHIKRKSDRYLFFLKYMQFKKKFRQTW